MSICYTFYRKINVKDTRMNTIQESSKIKLKVQMWKTNVHRKKFQECPTNAQRSKLGFRTLNIHNGKVRTGKMNA